MAEIWGLAAASVIGAGVSAYGASNAADDQASAAANAQQISENQFNTINQQEQPYNQSGTGALSQLNYLLGTGTPGQTPNGGAPTASSSTAGGYGSLVTPFTTQDFQQMSPAYNFQLGQGQQNVLNSDAAGAGALSGSAQKDLINYNQGLANTSFNNAFNQYNTQQSSIFSRLSGIANLGQSAASQTAQSGTALAGQAAQSATNIGTAQAGGAVGVSNAVSGGLSSAALPWLVNGGGGSSGPGPDNSGGAISSFIG